jgi:cytochrome b6-f complex iron-sulfur subunit
MPEKHENETSRRGFMKFAGAGAALLALQMMGCDTTDPMDDEPEPDNSSGIQISGNTITIDLTKTDAATLANAGGFLAISSKKVVVINTGDAIRAFTSICTHQACDISSFQNNRMRCPCHGSEFNTDGAAVSGPATGSLTEYTVTRSGDEVAITI